MCFSLVSSVQRECWLRPGAGMGRRRLGEAHSAAAGSKQHGYCVKC